MIRDELQEPTITSGKARWLALASHRGFQVHKRMTNHQKGPEDLHIVHRSPGKLLQNPQRCRRVVHTASRHDDGQRQTQAIPDNMAYGAIDLLAFAPTRGLAARATIHRLTVDAGRVPGLAGVLLIAVPLGQDPADCLQGDVVGPLAEVATGRAPKREALGEEVQLATVRHDVEDGIQGIAYGDHAQPAPIGHSHKSANKFPLVVGQVIGVVLAPHTIFTTAGDNAPDRSLDARTKKVAGACENGQDPGLDRAS